MRYNLGYLDKYHFEAAGTAIENVPMFRLQLRHRIDPIRLETAVRSALIAYPLFATQIEFDKEYYLRTNDRPLVISQYTEADRPKTFGRNTNRYPWRLFYGDNLLYLEWMHGITDGMCALNFLTQILMCYYGYEPEERSLNYLVAPGMEPFMDSKERGENYVSSPIGFPFHYMKEKYKGYKTDYHLLQADTAEVLALTHASNSSVAVVLAILASKALRKQLPQKARNRNVACNVVINLRKVLHYQTMHNCVTQTRVTYIDEYDQMSFSNVARIYHSMLNVSRLSPNLVRLITENLSLFKAYHIFPSRHWLKFIGHITAFFIKRRDCNFELSYMGKIEFPPEIHDQIESFTMKLWHDFGQSALIAWDYNDVIGVGISENFLKKGFVDDFIKISQDLGIHWEEVESAPFEQAHFDEGI